MMNYCIISITNLTIKRYFLLLPGLLFLLLPSSILAKSFSVDDFITFSGEEVGDYVGSSFGSGDFNGDGYTDILIGADGVSSRRGAVYLFYGSDSAEKVLAEMNIIDADATFLGENELDYASVIEVGDFNGDGYDDILFGAPHPLPGSLSGIGQSYLVYGGNGFDLLTGDILLSNADAKFTENSNENKVGSSLASGDFNGDGYDDIVIGASGLGRTYMLFGGSLPIESMPLDDFDVIFHADSIYDNNALTGGDVNNDGVDDLLLSFPSSNLAGKIYLFYGSRDKTFTGNKYLSSEYDAILLGETYGEQAGKSVTIGDFNGDYKKDLLIGGIGANAFTGVAYIIMGKDNSLSGTFKLSESDVVLTGERTKNGVGWSTASADINGDGYDDILIGAPGVRQGGHKKGGFNAGAVYVVFGRKKIIQSTNLCTAIQINGLNYDTPIGQLVTSAGDVNGDGNDEVLIGSSTAGTYNGIAYVGFLYVDIDKSGFLEKDGFDVDHKIEIFGNDIDDDNDGTIDEANILSIDDHHPKYCYRNPVKKKFKERIASIQSRKNGVIRVKYKDNVVYDYSIFNTKGTPIIKSYDKTGYAVVLHPNGGRLGLLNIYNGELVTSKKIQKNSNFKVHQLYINDVNQDNKTKAIIISQNRNNKKVQVVKIKIHKEEFGKISKKSIKSTAKINKAAIKNKKIFLLDKNGNILSKFRIKKKNIIVTMW